MQLLAGSPTAQLSIIPMATSIVIPTHIPMLSPMARSCWLAFPPMIYQYCYHYGYSYGYIYGMQLLDGSPTSELPTSCAYSYGYPYGMQLLAGSPTSELPSIDMAIPVTIPVAIPLAVLMVFLWLLL
jgi:hypothetical protein